MEYLYNICIVHSFANDNLNVIFSSPYHRHGQSSSPRPIIIAIITTQGKGSADDTDDDGIDDCEQERIDDLCDAYCHCECNEEVQNEIDGILSILGKGKAGGKSGKNGSGKNGSGKVSDIDIVIVLR